jgi:rhamnosyltransferase
LIPHSRKLHKLGAKVFCNPDGLEWKRSKWSRPAKLFLRYCEKCLVLNSDLSICDSNNIENYIKETYKGRVKKTTYIAYGAYTEKSMCSDEKIQEWYKQFNIIENNYYLIVGRFVPENNYETMITEFMKSKTKHDLVIITNVEKNKFYEKLKNATHFDQDKRIKFVGTVYNQELLKKIREEAFAYLHGHEVGGTNPSLLEALASTRINLLLNVGFNAEVAGNSALYWSKEEGVLSRLIDETDELSESRIHELDSLSLDRVKIAIRGKK